MRFALLVENAHLLNLTLVEDNSIFCESLLVYFPDTLVGFYGFLSLTVDASAYVTIETNRSLVVEFQGRLHFFALLAARNHECWVTANLEEDFLVVGILYVPDDMNLVALQAVRDGKVEVVRIVLLSLFVVDEREGEAVGSLANEFELCIACETMARKVILLALCAISVFPQSAYDREEDWRVAVPVFLVAIPEIFITISILDALKFCSER